MTNPTESQASHITRRSLVRGAAWAVPVVAVAVAAPARADSSPPPTTTPTFISSEGCGTTGNTKNGCMSLDKMPQVPFVIKNTTGGPLYFQITGMKSWQGGTAPAAWDNDFPNHFRLFTQNPPSSHDCSPEITSTMTCVTPAGSVTYLSILMQSNEERSLWLTGQAQGAASAFTMAVQSRWVDSACNVVVGTTEVSSTEISSNANCRDDKN